MNNIDLEIQQLTNNIAKKSSYSYITNLDFKEISDKILFGEIGDLGTFYVKNGRYIFVEAKAGDGTLTTVKVPNEPVLAEQGSKMYLSIILETIKVKDQSLYNIVKTAFENNELDYFYTIQRFNEDESLGEFNIFQFDI